MKVLLSQEEIQKRLPSDAFHLAEDDLKAGKSIAKAQARHLLKVLQEPCPHVHHFVPNRPKRACDACWAEIEQEIG